MRNYERYNNEDQTSDHVSGFSRFFGVYLGTRLVGSLFVNIIVRIIGIMFLLWCARSCFGG
ncbi:hypothetical protein ACFL20_10460 [Spirochaetota bacterium]